MHSTFGRRRSDRLGVVSVALVAAVLTASSAALAEDEPQPSLLTRPRSSLRYASGTYYEIAWEGGALPYRTAAGGTLFGTALRIRENDHILTKLAFIIAGAGALEGRPEGESREERQRRIENNEKVLESVSNAGDLRTATEVLLYSDVLGGDVSGFEVREYLYAYTLGVGPTALVFELGVGGGRMQGPILTFAPNQEETLHTRFGPVLQVHATLGWYGGVFLRAEPNLAGFIFSGPAQHPVTIGAQVSPFEQLFVQGGATWGALEALPSGWALSAGVRL